MRFGGLVVAFLDFDGALPEGACAAVDAGQGGFVKLQYGACAQAKRAARSGHFVDHIEHQIELVDRIGGFPLGPRRCVGYEIGFVGLGVTIAHGRGLASAALSIMVRVTRSFSIFALPKAKLRR